MIVTSDPEAARIIKRDNETYVLTPGLIDALEPIAAGSLAITQGNAWKSHRKILVSSFAPAQLRYATQVIDDLCNVLINKWTSNIKVKQYLIFRFLKKLIKFTSGKLN